MNAWGYIVLGLFCGFVGGFLLVLAAPSQLDIAIVAASNAMGDPQQAETNAGVALVGYLFAAASGVLTLIGVIGEGVRIGNRAA